MPKTPARSQRANVTPSVVRTARQDSWLASEIVPDSEEERQNAADQLIEISSDESNSDLLPGSWPETPNAGRRNVASTSAATPTRPPSGNARLRIRGGRRIIESSSDEENDGIIELSDSSPHHSSPGRATLSVGPDPEAATSYADDAILTLNEPRSARRPFRLPGRARGPACGSPLGEVIPDSQELAALDVSSDDGSPTHNETLALASTPRVPTRPKSTPRAGKKAQEDAKQKQREIYARELYVELNNVVFNDGLPINTKLDWNKRLLTTAGRAKYRRSREGVITAEIELAQKILDCEERIRFTLAHEMCHLAAWIIDNNPTEGHGKFFNSWARKVMSMRSDIEIRMHPMCKDVKASLNGDTYSDMTFVSYGRFSKSIKPDECACGSCKGRLTPLFTTRTRRAPRTPKMSRMAATTPNDSPLSVCRPATTHQGTRLNDGPDIVDLTRAIQSVTLTEMS